jgi:hypothetical protein
MAGMGMGGGGGMVGMGMGGGGGMAGMSMGGGGGMASRRPIADIADRVNEFAAGESCEHCNGPFLLPN